MLTGDQRFFYEHAGYCRMRTESEHEARERTARLLAAAEAALKSGPYFIGVSPDSEPWDGDTPWDGPVWTMTLYGVADGCEPVVIDSVSGIACESGDPHLRVLAAELAYSNALTEHVGPDRTGRVVNTAGAPMHPARHDHWADSRKELTGHEPFGTHVTIWDPIDGPVRGIVVKIERTQFAGTEYVTTQLCRSTGSVSYYQGVPSGVTLGWHKEGRP